eukprot:555434-Rhodomonas_salina.3
MMIHDGAPRRYPSALTFVSLWRGRSQAFFPPTSLWPFSCYPSGCTRATRSPNLKSSLHNIFPD